MKKLLKLVALLIVLVVLVVFLVLGYVLKFMPNVPVEEVKIEATPERIARGKYLAENVARCLECHSKRDWTKFSGPIVPGAEGAGGEAIGTSYPSNITPFKLKDWSDGEIVRAIVSGVSKDGRPLFPSMPYMTYGKMDKEDIYAIVAYIRTLPSVDNTPPPTVAKFPMSIIMHTIPAKAAFSPIPPKTDKINYGKYLAEAAMCAECHTPSVRGQPVQEKLFSGGRVFPIETGTLYSSNLTSDKETGIGEWTEDRFIQRFEHYASETFLVNQAVDATGFNSVMPWQSYARMTREDLSALYAYLQTVKPIQNKVPSTFVKK